MRENYNPANSVNGEDLVVSNSYSQPIDEDQYDALTFIEHELGLTFEGRDNMSAQLFIDEYHYEAQQSELDRLEYISTMAPNNEEITGEKEVVKDNTFNSLGDLTSAQVELVDNILEFAQVVGYIDYNEYEDEFGDDESVMEMRTSEDIGEIRNVLKGANDR